jgi:hypothetical protein
MRRKGRGRERQKEKRRRERERERKKKGEEEKRIVKQRTEQKARWGTLPHHQVTHSKDKHHQMRDLRGQHLHQEVHRQRRTKGVNPRITPQTICAEEQPKHDTFDCQCSLVCSMIMYIANK